MIIDRKGLLRFALFLVVIALVAGYLATNRDLINRWFMSREEERLTASPVMTSPPALPVTDFFIDYRLERDRIRAQQIELLRELSGNDRVDEAVRREANLRWLKLTEDIGREVEIENLLRAKGFVDAIAVLLDNAAVVVIKAASIGQPEAARIADIVARTAGVKLENLSIITKPD